jgi:hypothetical protein
MRIGLNGGGDDTLACPSADGVFVCVSPVEWITLRAAPGHLGSARVRRCNPKREVEEEDGRWLATATEATS